MTAGHDLPLIVAVQTPKSMMMNRIFLLLALVLTCQILSAQDPKAALAYVERGIKLHDKGDYDGALALYQKALDADADNLIALSEMGITFFKMERYDDVIQYSIRTIEKYPDSAYIESAYVNYGSALDATGKPREALKKYDEGIAKFPESHMLVFNKGITFAKMRQSKEAITTFQQAVKIEPRHASSHNALARMLYDDRQRFPAILAYLRFLVLEPNSPRAAENREAMQKLLSHGVEQEGKKNVNIRIDPSAMGDTLPDGSNKPNNFAILEMVVAMSSALDFDKKYAKESERERFLRKLELICGLLKEQRDKNSGFYWEYYAPYFSEMLDKKQTVTFSYLVFVSANDNAVNKWLEAHDDEIDDFYKWSKGYTWPE